VISGLVTVAVIFSGNTNAKAQTLQRGNQYLGHIWMVVLVLAILWCTPVFAAVLENQDWGTFPNCIAPAIPIETESWWDEKASPLPSDNPPGIPDSQRLISKMRHVHIAMCAPNSRTTDGSDGLIMDGLYDFVAVVTLHNHPGDVNFVNMTVADADHTIVLKKNCPDIAACDTVRWTRQAYDCVGGRQGCVRFLSRASCPTGTTCKWTVKTKLHIRGSVICNGLCEMRTMVNITGVAPRDDRQYADNHFQIHLGGTRNYRKTPAPRGRGWYEQLEYSSATIQNYMSLFNGRTDITVPIVSGTIPLRVTHFNGTGVVRSRLAIDPQGHFDIPGTIVYDVAGLKKGNVSLDTTTLTNGVHTLRLNTEESNEFGRLFGVIKYYINVQN
jgi:hypothetical protein